MAALHCVLARSLILDQPFLRLHCFSPRLRPATASDHWAMTCARSPATGDGSASLLGGTPFVSLTTFMRFCVSSSLYVHCLSWLTATSSRCCMRGERAVLPSMAQMRELSGPPRTILTISINVPSDAFYSSTTPSFLAIPAATAPHLAWLLTQTPPNTCPNTCLETCLLRNCCNSVLLLPGKVLFHFHDSRDHYHGAVILNCCQNHTVCSYVRRSPHLGAASDLSQRSLSSFALVEIFLTGLHSPYETQPRIDDHI